MCYEPRLKRVDITLLPELAPGHLRYDINSDLKVWSWCVSALSLYRKGMC